MKYTQHPLSAAFPAMSDEDFQALKDDIEVNGQREPVMLFEGMVLDGWHRYRAVTELGMTLKSFTKPDDEDPVVVAKSANMHRRHLTASQRAIAEVALHQWAPAGKQKAGAKAAAAAALPATTDTMAKDAKVSPRMIRDAKVVHKAGLSEPVRDGALTLEKAAAVARGKPADPPAKPVKRTIDQRPADVAPPSTSDDLKEAQDAITDLADENEKLRDRLAIEAMDASEEEKTQAAALITELRARVKTLEAELSAVKTSRDTYMRESGEKTRQIDHWRKRAEKAEKAVA